jgi:TldD protein
MALQLSFAPILPAAPPEHSASTKTSSANAGDPILKVMQGELSRATGSLSKTDPAPYFLSYTVNDQNIVVLVGAYGSLLTDAVLQRRQADVIMRVGSPALDNTHGQSRVTGMTSGSLPLGDDPDAISRVLWELTDREYKRAAPAFLNVKTNTAVRAEEEDKSPDFSKEAPQTHTGEALKPQNFDRAGWEGEIRRLSGAFRKYPGVYFASVGLQVQNSN